MLKADERLEKLLNRFGQTIYDLPKPTYKHYAYNAEHNINAAFAARDWENNESFPAVSDFTDYICHLADVIDRMETALETAALAIDCGQCEYWNDHGCGRKCKEIARIADYQLAGMTEREFEDFVKGEERTDA